MSDGVASWVTDRFCMEDERSTLEPRSGRYTPVKTAGNPRNWLMIGTVDASPASRSLQFTQILGGSGGRNLELSSSGQDPMGPRRYLPHGDREAGR